MKVTLWGTRGSTPIASAHTTRYGGNTTCVEIVTQAGDTIILDAGTGIRPLGNAMMLNIHGHPTPKDCTLCLTHAHWDHIMGLPFFAPLYSPLWNVHIYAHENIGGSNLDAVLRNVFNGVNFPLHWTNLEHPPSLTPCKSTSSFTVGSALVETCPTNHPGGNLAYKISADGWSFVFSGDHEYIPNDTSPVQQNFIQFLQGVDVAMLDGQYTRAEYLRHKGWGHSAMEDLPELATRAGVKRLIVSHHGPAHPDASLDASLDALRYHHNTTPLCIDFAHEGMSINASANSCVPAFLHKGEDTCRMCEFSREMFRFSDMGMVLDSLLSEARRLSNAEAGTIYLVKDEHLIFSYAQNDVLFHGSQLTKQLYLKASMPINTTSIAGYVATTCMTLNIPDVRQLADGLLYSFNEAFDNATGYRTVSMLTVPFLGKNNKILGVLQLINCLENTKPTPFPPPIQQSIEKLSTLGAHSIERAQLARDMILRMLQTSALRDPLETANHVMRVGATSAEIYRQWAENNNVPIESWRDYKDNIRLASMLHDVGKVGIPDAILKKPGKLTLDERKIMEQHSALGARLFANATLEADMLAGEIALHHHQRWDGTGYTGDPQVPALSGLDIPLGARITALADVFDALISPRCYKAPWPVAEALTYIKQCEGTHFDPEVVKAFLEIEDIILAIYQRFSDSSDHTDPLNI